MGRFRRGALHLLVAALTALVAPTRTDTLVGEGACRFGGVAPEAQERRSVQYALDLQTGTAEVCETLCKREWG